LPAATTWLRRSCNAVLVAFWFIWFPFQFERAVKILERYQTSAAC
jgi:hypothetical protein